MPKVKVVKIKPIGSKLVFITPNGRYYKKLNDEDLYYVRKKK